jgi:hypothetical protein
VADTAQDAVAASIEALRLRERAERLSAEAVWAREIEVGISRHHRLLQGRLDGVRARHRPDVWASAAATRSRHVLERELAFGLWLVLVDLGGLITRLRAAASDREDRAARDRRRADEIEAALAVARWSGPITG